MYMSVSRINRIILTGALLATAAIANGCSSLDRLSQIGEKPKLTEIENPTAQPGYKPVQMPMPKPEAASYNANSLWRNGSRAFFKDQRAHQIGDILTVTVNFTDKANIANETPGSPAAKEDSGITAFLRDKLIKNPPTPIPPRRLLPAHGTAPALRSGIRMPHRVRDTRSSHANSRCKRDKAADAAFVSSPGEGRGRFAAARASSLYRAYTPWPLSISISYAAIRIFRLSCG